MENLYPSQEAWELPYRDISVEIGGDIWIVGFFDVVW